MDVIWLVTVWDCRQDNKRLKDEVSEKIGITSFIVTIQSE